MFTFGLQTFVCVFSDVLIEIFVLHRYFSQYLSLYEVFNVHTVSASQNQQFLLKQSHSKLLRNFHTSLCRNISWLWLNLYQSSEASIFWILWSLVKPVILFLIWQPPAFPYRHQYSIIGRFRLNHRVRDVDGCFPKAHRHQKYDVIYSGLSLVFPAVLINN